MATESSAERRIGLDRRKKQIPVQIDRRENFNRREVRDEVDSNVEAKLPDIKAYISKECPLGPIRTDDITEPSIIRQLFDKENRIHRQLMSKPSYIVGRKGAGKTAFMRSIFLDSQYRIVVELRTYEAFSQVMESVEILSKRFVFVEAVADIWEMFVWTAIFHQISNSSDFSGNPKIMFIHRYLSDLVKGNFNAISSEQVAVIAASTLRSRCEGKVNTVSDCLNCMEFGSVSFEQAREVAKEILTSSNTRAVVLMDSLEDLDVAANSVRHSLQGLFKCLGRFHDPARPCEVRFCFPMELWYYLSDYSTNTLKDFEHSLIMQWHAGELMQIAAHRLKLYYTLHHADFIEKEKLYKLDPDDRRDARKIFDSVFPRVVENSLNNEEDTAAYILRHTQLLPRQFFLYLNKIFEANRRLGGANTSVCTRAIKEGIKSVEDKVTTEILNAYKYVYPKAKDACKKALPELPFCFSSGDMHRVFNRHARKVFPGDFEDFREMLVEVGAVGRVKNTTDRYVIGEFVYTATQKLAVSADDKLCIHPAFCKTFGSKLPELGGRVVYPYGTDIDGNDYRN